MAVGVRVDPDLGLDVVTAVPVLGDLQGEPFVSHGVVVADSALLLDAKDVVEGAGKGHEGQDHLGQDPPRRAAREGTGGRLRPARRRTRPCPSRVQAV